MRASTKIHGFRRGISAVADTLKKRSSESTWYPKAHRCIIQVRKKEREIRKRIGVGRRRTRSEEGKGKDISSSIGERDSPEEGKKTASRA